MKDSLKMNVLRIFLIKIDSVENKFLFQKSLKDTKLTLIDFKIWNNKLQNHILKHTVADILLENN